MGAENAYYMPHTTHRKNNNNKNNNNEQAALRAARKALKDGAMAALRKTEYHTPETFMCKAFDKEMHVTIDGYLFSLVMDTERGTPQLYASKGGKRIVLAETDECD